ncbi:MAG TPA: hypothetical protein VH500_22680 [Nitrososphaeraceae archaeon]|jgi:hypothetical protein
MEYNDEPSHKSFPVLGIDVAAGELSNERVGGSKSIQSCPTEFSPPPQSSPPDQEQDVIFSTQRSQMDYITWKGIENRTGIDKRNAYELVLKELLDNAVDSLELSSHNDVAAAQPQIHVSIEEEPQHRLFRIVVRNSNYSGKAAFSKSMLESIFNFDRFYSSKRNQFKINKGALGDAFKEILCIPYALAREEGIEGWSEPLIIRDYNANRIFSVHLVVDRINQTIQSEIYESSIAKTSSEAVSRTTEIELTLPLVLGADRSLLLYYVVKYTAFVTHVRCSCEDKNTGVRYEFPQLQPIDPKWKNLSSIYYYEPSQFQDFILGLENNDLQIDSVLHKTFREASNMKKTKLTQITVGRLKQSRKLMDGLYDELRRSMNPPAPNSLALPFDVTKKARERALKSRIEQSWGHVLNIKYKSIFGCYKLHDGQLTVPCFFEIAVCNIEDLGSNLMITQALNCSATAAKRMVFQGCQFNWMTQGSNSIYESLDIREIFEHFGYSYSKDKCRKPNSLILVNLMSPRIDYQSYGKSSIDFVPFANIIAEAIVKACMGGSGRSDGRPSKRTILLEVLQDRKQRWKAMDEVSRLRHWWTQSDVFYVTRRLLIEKYGYKNEEIDRDYLTGLIKPFCEDELRIKREHIGIIAADRAQLYFKGQWMDVGLKEIDELSLYGVDMLIIEKEGIAEQLAIFADQKGIALLNTRGFLTDYAEILSKKSDKEGCNIAILTDFDASGLVLASKVSRASRIGIDFQTLADLGLNIRDVEEEYAPGNHLKTLQHGGDLADAYPEFWIDYIKSKRVEINSVITALDDNEKFWTWITEKLRDQFDKRNYNRAVVIPEYVMPKCLESLNKRIEEIGIEIFKKWREELQKLLSTVGPGFLFDRTDRMLLERDNDIMTIDNYEATLTDHSRHIIESDKRIKPLLDEIDALNYVLEEQETCEDRQKENL